MNLRILVAVGLGLGSAAAALAAAEPAGGGEKERFAAAADYSARHGGRAVLIERDGTNVFERYDNGWRAERPHPLASGTKSFTGVLAMMAVQDGLLTLDEKAADTLTEWKDDPRKSRITVRQLLQLSSGLTPGDRELGGRGGGLLLGWAATARATRLGLDDNAPQPDDKFRAALDLSAINEPGAKFDYGPGHFCAFGELLERKLAKSKRPEKTVMAYLRQRLLEPVGIHDALFASDKTGHPNLPGGAVLTARDWARFGRFVLDDGSVRQPDGTKKSLLKPELLAECFKPSPANPAYGLTWWLPGGGTGGTAVADAGGGTLAGRVRARVLDAQNQPIQGPDGKPVAIHMAAGLGKQRLYVIPSQRLVIVRFAEGTQEGMRFDDRAFLAPILGQPAAEAKKSAPAASPEKPGDRPAATNGPAAGPPSAPARSR